MKKTFSELQTYFANRRGFDAFSKMEPHEQNVAKDMLNTLRDVVWFHKQWAFTERNLQFTTVSAYTTGTISGSAGEHTVTGDGTAWPNVINGVQLRSQYMRVNGILYRILRRTSTTKIVLEAGLKEDIAAGTAYSIHFIEYPVRQDVAGIRDAKIDIEPLEIRPKNMVIPIDTDIGFPEIIYPAGQTEVDFATATATLTNDSTTVSSVSGITIDENLIGMAITQRTAIDTYYIVDVDSGASTFTLDRPFGGATAVATTVVLNSKGTPLLGLKPFPDTRRVVEIEYTKEAPIMVDDDALSGLPNDLPILKGIDVLTTKWESVGEKGFINEVLFQNKEFKDSLRVLAMRGSPTHRRMYSTKDLHQRFRRDTNPWNRIGRGSG